MIAETLEGAIALADKGYAVVWVLPVLQGAEQRHQRFDAASILRRAGYTATIRAGLYTCDVVGGSVEVVHERSALLHLRGRYFDAYGPPMTGEIGAELAYRCKHGAP